MIERDKVKKQNKIQLHISCKDKIKEDTDRYNTLIDS